MTEFNPFLHKSPLLQDIRLFGERKKITCMTGLSDVPTPFAPGLRRFESATGFMSNL